MSELDVVLGETMPLIGAAVQTYGTGVLSRVEDAAAEVTVALGRRLLDRIRRRAARPAALDAAVEDLAAVPGDGDALGALRLQVRKVLAQDAELVHELAGMLPVRGTAHASGAGALAAGGDVSVSAPGGVAGGVLNGPVVVVNPQLPGPGVG